MYTTSDLFDLSHTLAADYLARYEKPWEALAGIKALILELGPTLPAFLSPNVAKVLAENFGIGGIGSVEDDIKAMIG